jgi:indolepyruvate ferredoxin oxidoreductase alpha subunit
MKRSIIGNQAVAYGALAAGIDVAAGYPGTPSSEALNELLHFSRSAARGNDPSPYVEWSVNEKVAFELATGAAWAGKRALATMKMSGANVAADSILSVAYSGTKGGLVLYIADDPGAEAGMPEQDTRLFAQWRTS